MVTDLDIKNEVLISAIRAIRDRINEVYDSPDLDGLPLSTSIEQDIVYIINEIDYLLC